MAKLIDSVKALGEKITGEKINGDTLFAAVKDAGEKMTGKELEGKGLNDVIAETAKEYQGGGGTVVVDELPKTGEANTIYELHEQIEHAYNWVAEINVLINEGNFNPVQNGGYLLVVETYDDMLAKVNEDTHLQEMTPAFVYLRAEDRMFANIVDAESGNIMRMEFQKNSAYSFELEGKHLYVLKSIHTGEEITEDIQYYGVLYNGNEVELHYNQDKAFILHQATSDYMDFFNATGVNLHQVSTLPTASEAVANYLDDLIVMAGRLYVKINDQIKDCYGACEDYYWDDELPNFVAVTEESTEEPVIYTGELKWHDNSDPLYSEIPYQDIFDDNVGAWFFQPGQGGEKVSYWVYANNVWTNLDNVGEIVMPVTSVGDYGFNSTGLDLEYFDFYINGIKAECVQYGTLVVGGDGETEEDPRVCPIGYLKGIVLPTTESNHYSVEVRFKGTFEQISGLKYLQLSILGFGDNMWSISSNIIKQRNLLDPMTLEFDGLHEILIGCRTDTL